MSDVQDINEGEEVVEGEATEEVVAVDAADTDADTSEETTEEDDDSEDTAEASDEVTEEEAEGDDEPVMAEGEEGETPGAGFVK